jgi:hypothetical protein
MRITKENLRNYGSGTQQEIAEAVSLGVLQVNELDGVHVSPDKTPIPKGPFEPAPAPAETYNVFTDEERLIEECIEYKNFYNTHVLNAAVHTTAGSNTITTADPTNYAQCYTLISEAITDLNAHAPNGVVHPVADTSNTVTAGAPGTPSAAFSKLDELWAVLQTHMTFAYTTGTVLSPADIIGYT